MKKAASRFLFDTLVIFSILIVFIILPFRFLLKKLFKRGLSYSLWTGTPILNMAINAKAERLLNVKSASLVYRPYFITSAFDYNLERWCSQPFVYGITVLGVFIWACMWIDRFHFYCDRGILPSRNTFDFDLRELYVYKLLNIPVFLWTYGADIRSSETTRNLGEPNCCTECTLVGKACICNELSRKQNIDYLNLYSTAIFSMGDMIEYTPDSRNDLFFWPVDIHGDNAEKYRPIYPSENCDKPLNIVHAPNHRMFKGTHFLIEAIEKLQSRGFPVQLTLVEKLPNSEALKIYRTADIIFDQCLIGFHGYFALEGMAMGKPVMCYIRKPQEYLLNPEECPIINTHIDTLEQDIEELVNDRDRLRKIGIKSRQYIEKYFTLDAFADRLKKAYQDLGVTI